MRNRLPFHSLHCSWPVSITSERGRATDGTDREQWAECVKTILDGAPDAVLEKTTDDDNERLSYHSSGKTTTRTC